MLHAAGLQRKAPSRADGPGTALEQHSGRQAPTKVHVESFSSYSLALSFRCEYLPCCSSLRSQIHFQKLKLEKQPRALPSAHAAAPSPKTSLLPASGHLENIKKYSVNAS